MARTAATKAERLEKAKRDLLHSKAAVSRWTRRLRLGTSKLRAWSRRVKAAEKRIEELSAPPARTATVGSVSTARQIRHEEE
jgi:hypothetical protein